MCAGKMHTHEVEIDASLVRRLIAAQFPKWEELPITPVRSAGTVNAMYRLGGDLAVRMPRVHVWADDLKKENHWLPKLAPHLPLTIPDPMAMGIPGEGYPFNWSVYRWLEGDTWSIDRIDDENQAAEDLARFILALQGVDTAGAPVARPGSGRPLAERDEQVCAAIAALGALVDTATVSDAWEEALQAPVWDAPPVWIHADLLPSNLLVEHGRLSAVIDFGGACVGDPACDLMSAWTLFSKESRDVYRIALSVDEATWARGRGRALSKALIFIPYYLNTNPVGVASARRALDEVISDYEQGR